MSSPILPQSSEAVIQATILQRHEDDVIQDFYRLIEVEGRCRHLPAFMVRMQLPVPLQVPDQPAKKALVAGVAVSLTLIPELNNARISMGRHASCLLGCIYWALKNNAASGGRVSFSEKGRPCVGIASACTPPRLPMPLPAYSRASLLSISRQ